MIFIQIFTIYVLGFCVSMLMLYWWNKTRKYAEDKYSYDEALFNSGGSWWYIICFVIYRGLEYIITNKIQSYSWYWRMVKKFEGR